MCKTIRDFFVVVDSIAPLRVEIAWQNKIRNKTDDIPVIWEQKFGFPTLQAHLISRPPCKRAYNEYTRYKRNHVTGIYIQR